MSTTRRIAESLKTVRNAEETINLLAIPTSRAILNSSSAVAAGTASSFLGGVVPVVGMLDGGLTFLGAVVRIIERYSALTQHNFSAYVSDIIDAFSSLPFIVCSYDAMSLHLAGAVWQSSLPVAALGYAIKAGYDFMKAAAILYYADERTSQEWRDLFIGAFKCVGFLFLTLGSVYFMAGFVCLGVAGAVSLYQNSKWTQKLVDPLLNLFKCGSSNKDILTNNRANNTRVATQPDQSHLMLKNHQENAEESDEESDKEKPFRTPHSSPVTKSP